MPQVAQYMKVQTQQWRKLTIVINELSRKSNCRIGEIKNRFMSMIFRNNPLMNHWFLRLFEDDGSIVVSDSVVFPYALSQYYRSLREKPKEPKRRKRAVHRTEKYRNRRQNVKVETREEDNRLDEEKPLVEGLPVKEIPIETQELGIVVKDDQIVSESLELEENNNDISESDSRILGDVKDHQRDQKEEVGDEDDKSLVDDHKLTPIHNGDDQYIIDPPPDPPMNSHDNNPVESSLKKSPRDLEDEEELNHRVHRKRKRHRLDMFAENEENLSIKGNSMDCGSESDSWSDLEPLAVVKKRMIKIEKSNESVKNIWSRAEDQIILGAVNELNLWSEEEVLERLFINLPARDEEEIRERFSFLVKILNGF